MSDELINRKDFLKKGFFRFFNILGDTLGDNLGILKNSPIRPPGAIAEKEFLDTCQKCGKCVEACPQDSIKFSGIEAAFTAGFPVVVPSERPCFVCDDLSCMKACPSGALILTQKTGINMGIAEVLTDKCITYNEQQCSACVSACPFPEDAIFIDADSHPLVTNYCIGCGLCEYWCDFNAIVIKSSR